MPKNKLHKLSALETFQVVVGILISLATITIGWKTYQLNDTANESTTKLKSIEQQLSETKFGFERIRDIYDRTEKYLSATEQNERRGRALVALINSLPDSSIRSDLLSILIREATANSVAANAADAKQGKPITDAEVKSEPNKKTPFFGEVYLKYDPDRYTIETLGNFGFEDSSGFKWEVPKGKIFNGASVPRALWDVIGSPLSSDYAPSFILLEHFSELKNRTPEQVYRMFYESLLKSGLSKEKTDLFFKAISVFGPRWTVSEQK